MPVSNDDKFTVTQDMVGDDGDIDSIVEIVSRSMLADGLESTEFMARNDEELVDLDALFDALNLVAQENADAFVMSDSPQHENGVLTVSNEALAATRGSSGLDDVEASAAEGLSDHVISDES